MGEAESLPRGMENGFARATPGHVSPHPFGKNATQQKKRTPGTACVLRLSSWNWKVPVVFEETTNVLVS